MMRLFHCILIGTLTLNGCSSNGNRPTRSTTPTAAPIQRFVAERNPWTYQGNPGWIYHTPSSTIHTTITDRQMLIRIPSFIETAQIHARTALTMLPPPPRPVDTYFLGSRKQWETMTRKLLKDKASIYLAIERGGYSIGTTGVYYDLGPRDSFSIAAHEGWHQYARSVMQDHIPVWLDEGIACYLEGFKWDPIKPDQPIFLPWSNLERHDQLRKAHASGSLMSIHALVSNRPQDLMATDKGADRVLTYYAQLWALVHFFKEYQYGQYSSGLSQTLHLSLNGTLLNQLSDRDARTMRIRRSGPGVLSIIAPGVELKELDQQFQHFIEQIVRPGSRNAILNGQSPIKSLPNN